jgi:hypothetical protein
MRFIWIAIVAPLALAACGTDEDVVVVPDSEDDAVITDPDSDDAVVVDPE